MFAGSLFSSNINSELCKTRSDNNYVFIRRGESLALLSSVNLQ